MRTRTFGRLALAALPAALILLTAGPAYSWAGGTTGAGGTPACSDGSQTATLTLTNTEPVAAEVTVSSGAPFAADSTVPAHGTLSGTLTESGSFAGTVTWSGSVTYPGGDTDTFPVEPVTVTFTGSGCGGTQTGCETDCDAAPAPVVPSYPNPCLYPQDAPLCPTATTAAPPPPPPTTLPPVTTTAPPPTTAAPTTTVAPPTTTAAPVPTTVAPACPEGQSPGGSCLAFTGAGSDTVALALGALFVVLVGVGLVIVGRRGKAGS